MKYLMCFVSLVFIFLYALVGCTPTVPTVRVWQPWWRTLESEQKIYLGATMKTEVVGRVNPLLGSQQLFNEEIRKTLNYLLNRRGFIVQSDSSELSLVLTYDTERHDRTTSFLASGSSNVAYQYSSTYSSAWGLGVSAARAVAASKSASSNQVLQVSREVTSYTHTVSLEICGISGEILWKGESSWDSPELSIMSELRSTLQLILSNLPRDPESKTDISEVDSLHSFNYFKLMCDNRWFSCPGLPYKIAFKRPEYGFSSLPSCIKNPNALDAYIDLMQCAEYALPDVDKDWKNPLRSSLWSRTILGGQYLLGPQRKPVNVMIKLSGESSGYFIDKCWIAADAEYRDFQQQLLNWQNALQDYYDVFVH